MKTDCVAHCHCCKKMQIALIDTFQLDQDFWDKEELSFWEMIMRIALLTLILGGTGGIKLLPPEIQPLFDVDRFNQSALDWLALYRFSTVFGISETTRIQSMKAIEEWIRAGEAFPVLEAKLTVILGEARAASIAVTEVTRIYAHGNILAWQNTGFVSGKKWNTVEDDRVCIICRPLDGTVVALDGNWFIPEPSAGGLGLDKPIFAPPAHVNGRCFLTPVVDDEAFRESIRRSLNA